VNIKVQVLRSECLNKVSYGEHLNFMLESRRKTTEKHTINMTNNFQRVNQFAYDFKDEKLYFKVKD